MIGAKVEAALNRQIKEELESAYLYLSMAAYFHSRNLDGMAHWMHGQAREEHEHAMKFFYHVVERGGRVELTGLGQPRKEWDSPLSAFQEAYRHEQYITGEINNLYQLAMTEGDYPAVGLLQWFITEQVEEEASVSRVVEQLKMVGDSGSGLIMLDRELGKRGE